MFKTRFRHSFPAFNASAGLLFIEPPANANGDADDGKVLVKVKKVKKSKKQKVHSDLLDKQSQDTVDTAPSSLSGSMVNLAKNNEPKVVKVRRVKKKVITQG